MPTYPIVLVPKTLESILSLQPELPSKPTLPLEPEMPPEPTAPPEPLAPASPKDRFINGGWALGIAIVAFLLIPEPLKLIAVGIAAIWGAYDATLGHRNRLENYQTQLRIYQVSILPQWQDAKANWERDKERICIEWEEQCNALVKDWENKKQVLTTRYAEQCKELLSPVKVANWRSQRIKQAVTAEIEYNEAPDGHWDEPLYKFLKSRFPELDIQWMMGIQIPDWDGKFTPDIIVHDPYSHIWIDIEIDEPWFYKERRKQPAHYVGKDDNRNNFFLERNWIVIRFAESQVADYMDLCAKEIAKVLDKFRSDTLFSARFDQTNTLPVVEQWAKEEAVGIERKRRRM